MLAFAAVIRRFSAVDNMRDSTPVTVGWKLSNEMASGSIIGGEYGRMQTCNPEDIGCTFRGRFGITKKVVRCVCRDQEHGLHDMFFFGVREYFGMGNIFSSKLFSRS